MNNNALTTHFYRLILCCLSFLAGSQQASATILDLNYTFTTATAGTTVTVTWTTDNPSDMVNIGLIRMSIFTVVQTMTGLPNSGSASFFINNAHPPGQYQFGIETVDRTFWNYGEIFELLPASTCCQSQPAFIVAAQQGFNAFEQQCGIALTPKALTACHQTTYTWGDGSSTGPITGNVSANHLYTAPGFYQICAKVEEINSTGNACFRYDTCWQVCVTCDTCRNPIVRDVWSKLPATTSYVGGNNAHAQIYSDPTGDYYMIGTYSGTFDNGADPDFANQGAQDCVVAKYKNDGSIVPGFAFNIGGTLSDVGAAIAPHFNDGFFVGGIFYSPTLTLTTPGSGPDAMLNKKSASTHADVFLARYDNALNIVWALNFGGLNNTQINDMAVDADGNVLITGVALAKTNYNPLGSATTSTVDNYAAYTAKYNGNDGKLIWVRSVIGALNLGLDLDNTGNAYVSGHFQGPAFIDGSPLPSGGFPTLGINSVPLSGGDVAPYIIKFNSNGDFQWVVPIQNASGPKTSTGTLWDVSVKDSKLFAIGNAVTNVALDFGGSLITLPATRGQFIARYNLNGVLEDHAVLPQYSNAFKLETVNGGKVYIGGYYGGGVLMTEIYDHDLNPVKTMHTGPGSSLDAVWALAPDISGDFVVAGISGAASLDFDPVANDGLEYPVVTAPSFVLAKFTCDCPGPAPVVCSPCDSVSVRFDRRLFAGQQPGGCCANAFVINQKANYFYGVTLKAVSGGKLYYSNATARPGWQKTSFLNGVSVAFEPVGGGPIPTGTDDFAFFCMDDLTHAEQVIEIQYFNQRDSVLCRDTLRFQCDYCVDFTKDTAICAGVSSRKITFCLKVSATQDWNVNALVLSAPPGISFSPAAFSIPNVAPGAEYCSLTTTATAAGGTAFGDTLCFKVTAHQNDILRGFPPGYCCESDICVALPDCLCDSTFATAEPSAGGDSCCWQITLQQPAGAFTQVNTHIVTPGIVFSSVMSTAGWDMSLHTMNNISWTPEAPQGTTIQNGYPLPEKCFEEDGSGTAVSPFRIAVTWWTADSMPCYDTILVYCPQIALQTDCVFTDSVSFTCRQLPLGHTIRIRVYNLTSAPPFDADRVQFFAIGPGGVNIGPAIQNTVILNGSYADLDLHILNANPGDKVACYVTLYDLNDQGAVRLCCTSDFCFILPDCQATGGGAFEVFLAPNPTAGNITLQFDETGSVPEVGVRLLDIAGRVLYEANIPEGTQRYEIAVPERVQGLFFVELLERDKRVWTGKAVKQ